MRHRFDAVRAFAGGRHDGTAVDAAGALVFGATPARESRTDPLDPDARVRELDVACWTGPVVELGFPAAEAIPG
ncbi:hypothetical protein [Agromyces archimandritae]|uniref:Uncharacterized protein n=1 Tax=Agromyces archimandritae TaxID=2781962 RepID=A0A975IPS7_9MICO|nr:hypothetical protein [Agromyces archimandritae]QTX05915.1 hypothetical protein G127AT_06915 [Agromyces archimandritae]